MRRGTRWLSPDFASRVASSGWVCGMMRLSWHVRLLMVNGDVRSTLTLRWRRVSGQDTAGVRQVRVGGRVMWTMPWRRRWDSAQPPLWCRVLRPSRGFRTQLSLGPERHEAGLGRGPDSNWGGWIRTTNFPGNSRAVCHLTYTPSNGSNLPHAADKEATSNTLRTRTSRFNIGSLGPLLRVDAPVQPPVLDRLRHLRGPDHLATLQVRDRPRQAS